jgi:hypothetical protein
MLPMFDSNLVKTTSSNCELEGVYYNIYTFIKYYDSETN